MNGNTLREDIQTLETRIKRLAQSKKGCSSKALKAFSDRLDRLNEQHNRLPVPERLAASQVMYNELEEVLMRFELINLSPPHRPLRVVTPKSRSRWN